MLTQNKSTAIAFLHAMGAGDRATLEKLTAPDAQIITAGYCKLSMTHEYDSIMGVADALPKITKAGIAFDILLVTAEDDRVAVQAQGHAESIDGTPYNNQYHFLLQLRDGQVWRMYEYMDTQLAETVLGPYLAAAAAG